MRESLRIGDTPKDVNSAKQLIQEHEEKWEDIQTHNDRYTLGTGGTLLVEGTEDWVDLIAKRRNNTKEVALN